MGTVGGNSGRKAGDTLFLIVVALLAVAIAVAVARGGQSGNPTRGSLATAVVGLVWALSVSTALFLTAPDDEGAIFVLVVLGLPVLVSAVAASAATSSGNLAVALGWGCSLILTMYVLLFGLGPGLFFAPSALLLIVSMLLRRHTTPPVRR